MEARIESPHPLTRFGWTDQVAADLASAVPDAEARSAEVGRVTRVDRRGTQVMAPDGLVRVSTDGRASRSAGVLDQPAVGDWVVFVPDDRRPAVIAVLPRHGVLTRRDPADRASEQILAANLDHVFIFVPLDRDLSLAWIERSLVLVHESGADPAVLLSKADVAAEFLSKDVAEAEAEVRTVTGDDPVHVISAVTGQGIDALRRSFENNATVAMFGASGAGKSTLVNALIGDEQQETGDVRSGDARGRHTTTTRHLLPIPGGGVILDTPGLRALGLWEATAGLERAFPEIEALAAGCRFRDCQHDAEPGCAVRAAVESGELEARRLDSFHKLVAEADAVDRQRTEQRQAQGEGRRPPRRRSGRGGR